MAHAKPFTPETLADRWDVSAETVRALARERKIGHFKVGKQYRFPVAAVEEYECQTSASEDCGTVSVSTGQILTLESADGISLRHAPERKRKQRQ